MNIFRRPSTSPFCIARFSFFALMATLAVGCSGSSELTGQELADHLAAKTVLFEAAYNDDTIDNVMAMFTDDASLSPGGDQTFSNPAQVRAILQESMQTTDNLSLSIRETTPGDGTAEQTGRYVVDDGSEFGLSGGFTLSWRRTDAGEWLVTRLAWTQ